MNFVIFVHYVDIVLNAFANLLSYAQNYVHDYEGIIGLIKPSSHSCVSYSPIYVSQSFANEINFEDGHL